MASATLPPLDVILSERPEKGHAKRFCGGGGVQRDGVLFCPWRIKEVAKGSQGDHQGIVRDLASGENNFVVRAADCSEVHVPGMTIELDDFAACKSEAVQMCQHGVGEPLLVDIEGAGGNLMQRRLPNVKRLLVDKCDEVWAEATAQARSQLEAARAATGYDDAMRRSGRAHGGLRQ